MIQILEYVIGGAVSLYVLVAIGVFIAAQIRAARDPIDEPTLADNIRERRRAWLWKNFPGLLPEDQAWGVRGSWYLGVPCSRCGEMIPIMADASCGQGPIEVGAGDISLERCCRRGHLTKFRVNEMRRFQAD